jgi:hypothetical protein
MVFRDFWVKHQGLVSCHSEVFAHAVDHVWPSKPVSVLHAGFGNGGTLQVLSSILPEGSSVLGIGSSIVNDVPCVIADLSDRGSVFWALRSQWFDWVIDSDDSAAILWPYLRAGGKMFLDNYDEAAVLDLLHAVAYESESWLPTEEILSIILYPHVAIVEKRYPRVVPYLDVIIGEEDPLIPIKTFQDKGAMKVFVEPEKD